MPGAIVIGNSQALPHQPKDTAAPAYYTRSSWNGAWQHEPYFEWAGCSISAAGHGDSACEAVYRYGQKQWLKETSHSQHLPLLNMVNKYLRCDLVDNTVHRVVFQGRIREERRTVHGTKEYDGADVEFGTQRFIAYGPESDLHKTHMSVSYWMAGGSRVACEWIPPMNTRDREGRLLGNRSTYPEYTFGSYLYGGTSKWSHYEYLEYLVKHHFPAGPHWYIGGQAGLLADMYSQIDIPHCSTLREILSRVISPEFGVDYHLVPVDDGYVVYVFALNPQAVDFGGYIMPANTDHVKIKTTSDVGLIYNVDVERTEYWMYSGVRVWGQRAIICASPAPQAKWDSDLEDEYLQGTGSALDDAEAHDNRRRIDRYDHVFTRFGAAPTWTLSRQAAVRDTLSYLPLREGYDYSTSPPTNESNPAGHVAGFQRPNAWVKTTGNVYVPAAKAGLNITPLDNDWGLQLEGRLNHKLALNHDPSNHLATYASNLTLASTGEYPCYDYDDLVMTIAFYADTRLKVEYITTGGDGTIKEVYVSCAQLHYLAPETIVGVDKDTGALKTSGSSWRTLRDDSEDLYLLVAGLMARYITDRSRAVVSAHSLFAANGLIGKILTVVDGSSDTQTVQAPITNVQLTEQGDTFFRTGYAQA